MKYGKAEIRDALRALKNAMVYNYEPAAVTLEVALDCLEHCLKVLEESPTLMPIPPDAIELARKQGYNEGWREGTEALIKLWWEK